MTLTTLQTRILGEIVAYVRRENLPVGTHLTETHLAEVVGTSRFPVSAALAHLAKLGVVKHDRNRGFFLADVPASLTDVAMEWSAAAEDPLYVDIARRRQKGELADAVNEADLMREFAVSRNSLRKVLSRIQQEGWIERRAGHGWEFLPMIDSAEAYEESYALRLAVEPAGILSPKFKADEDALAACRKQQSYIVSEGYQTMTAKELFEANARFHETIAEWSGNRFIVQTIRRQDQLRRLVEYIQADDRPPRKAQAEEHLRMLDFIAAGEIAQAAALMHEHLEGARRAKAGSAIFAKVAPSDKTGNGN